MAGSLDPTVLKEPLLILASAAIVVPLFHRLRISPALGFIIFGMLIGPFGFGSLVELFPVLSHLTIEDEARAHILGELGVVFLMFMIGLELSFERLNAMKKLVFGLGTLQVSLCTAALAGVLYWIGLPFEAAVVFGVALAQSSTVIVIQVLAEQKKLLSPVGRTSFAILLFQDLAVVPIMFLVGLLATKTDAAQSKSLVETVLPAIIVIPSLLFVGRLILRPWFRMVAMAKSPEYFMAACLLVVMATALVVGAAGLSMALGALLAGLLLAETEYRREIEITIEPFKGLLLGIFLLTVGMGIDIQLVASDPLPIFSMAVGLIAIKATIITLLCRIFRKSWGTAVQTAMMIGPAGEFAFIILGLALNLGIVPETQTSIALIVVAFTMALIPLLAKIMPGIVKKHSLPKEYDVVATADQKVVLVGFGRVGSYIGSQLEKFNIAYVAIDNDAARVAAMRDKGISIYYSDAKNIHHASTEALRNARALVVTIGSGNDIEEIVRIARKKAPKLPIIARARDATHAQKLFAAGATDIVPEAWEASLQLAQSLLVDLGLKLADVAPVLQESRDEYRKKLRQEAKPEASAHARRREGRRKATSVAPDELIEVPQDSI